MTNLLPDTWILHIGSSIDPESPTRTTLCGSDRGGRFYVLVHTYTAAGKDLLHSNEKFCEDCLNHPKFPMMVLASLGVKHDHIFYSASKPTFALPVPTRKINAH